MPVADIENQFLTIEAAGANIDIDLVNEVFRAVHSIKGASGFLGFSTLGALAHSLENVLNLIRNGELVPDTAIVDVLLRAADTLRGMVEDIHNSNDVDVSEHVAELQDSLMNLAGELVLSRNQLMQAVSSTDGASLDSVAGRLNQVTSELQEAIMQTRMQVVGTVFGKFPRVVRDLSKQLGKQCRLTLEGKEEFLTPYNRGEE